MSGVLGSVVPNCLVVFSTSAHPSLALMARDLRIPAHFLYDRVKNHSIKHGRKVLADTVLREYLREERNNADTVSKRLRADLLHFAVVEAPDVQPVFYGEVPLDESTPSWRRGFDSYPAPDVLEDCVPTLMQHELSAMSVSPMLKNGVAKGLTARAALKEGDVILPAPCLSFSSPEGVREFLNQGGNGAFVEGPLLKVKKIRQADGAVCAIYSVLLGAARLLRDFREQVVEPKVAKFRRPNACFRVRPERGAARRLINQCGAG